MRLKEHYLTLASLPKAHILHPKFNRLRAFHSPAQSVCSSSELPVRVFDPISTTIGFLQLRLRATKSGTQQITLRVSSPVQAAPWPAVSYPPSQPAQLRFGRFRAHTTHQHPTPCFEQGDRRTPVSSTCALKKTSILTTTREHTHLARKIHTNPAGTDPLYGSPSV